MGAYAKDGTPHHSLSRARMHDEMSGTQAAKKEAPPAVKKMAVLGVKAGAEHPEPTGIPIEDHVAEHGPAHEIHYHHDKETEKHHVTSHHGEGEDGHHHSVHDTHEAAHEHMAKAMDIGNAAEREPQDHEEFETPDTEQAEMTRAKGGIPGLA